MNNKSKIWLIGLILLIIIPLILFSKNIFGAECNVALADDCSISTSMTLTPGTYYLNDTASNGILRFFAHNVVLDCQGATIIGNTTGVGVLSNSISDNITVKNCNFVNYTYGIQKASSSGGGISVYNNTFIHMLSYGVYLQNTKNSSIDLNTFINPITYGGTVQAVTGVQTEKTRVLNNFFGNSTDRINGSISSRDAIAFTSGNNDTTIDNNQIWMDVARNGINFVGAINTINNNVMISNNLIYLKNNSISYGIIAGIEDNPGGNYTKNITIQNNIVYAPRTDGSQQTHGILLGHTNISFVINNTVYNTTVGIGAKNSLDCLFANNTLDGQTETNDVGMYDKGNTNCQFLSNKFYNNSDLKTYPNDATGNNPAVNSTWKDNQVYGSGLSYIKGNSSSIWINHTNPNNYSIITVPGTNYSVRWYYRAFVNYSNGSSASNVNISIYDKNSNFVTNLTTDSNGYTSIYDITDYNYTSGTFLYLSNYSITVQKTGYDLGNHSFNATRGNDINNVFTLSETSSSDNSTNTNSQLVNTSLKLLIGFITLIILGISGYAIFYYARNNFTVMNTIDFFKYSVAVLIAIVLMIALIGYIVTLI